jgi:hypothetical protein
VGWFGSFCVSGVVGFSQVFFPSFCVLFVYLGAPMLFIELL